MKVFLSHSSTDKELARRLARDLQSANVDVWLDQWEVRVGEEFAQRIERGLDEVAFVIVLLTRASVASEWVDREWRRKFEHEAQTKRFAIVPVRGEACEIPDFLAQRSHADISGGSYPLGFRHLLTILQHYSDEASIKFPQGKMEGKDSSQTMLPIVTPIALEIGRDLIPIFEPDGERASRALGELAPAVREALRAEFGFSFPGIRVVGNETDMAPRGALILIDEIPEIMIEVGCDDVLVAKAVDKLAAVGITAERRDDPATGQAHAVIGAVDRAAAQAAGLVTWDAAEYLFRTLQVVVRRMAPLFLDIDVTRGLVDSIARTAPDLVGETVPKRVSWFELTDVLRRLVDEEIGIGDMRRILEALSRCESDRVDTVLLAEHVRHALRGQITTKFARGRDSVPVFLLDAEIEGLMSRAIQRTSVGAYLMLEPQVTQEILGAIREQVSSLGARAAGAPILVTAVEVRRYVRKLVELEFPSLHVVSRQDFDPDTHIQPVARISLEHTSPGASPTGQGRAG